MITFINRYIFENPNEIIMCACNVTENYDDEEKRSRIDTRVQCACTCEYDAAKRRTIGGKTTTVPEKTVC